MRKKNDIKRKFKIMMSEINGRHMLADKFVYIFECNGASFWHNAILDQLRLSNKFET